MNYQNVMVYQNKVYINCWQGTAQQETCQHGHHPKGITRKTATADTSVASEPNRSSEIGLHI